MAEPMEEAPTARGLVCALSHMRAHNDAHRGPGGDETDLLSTMHAGWFVSPLDPPVPPSCANKIAAFVIARPAVLHVDEILNNKKDPMQVRRLLPTLIKQRVPVQVAFLQGTLPLQHRDLFPWLLAFLLQCPVWSVNLGELRFSEAQCRQLAQTLRYSGITHMFYECTVAGQWKEIFRSIIRTNRSKHGMWRLGPDDEQNKVVFAAVKNWYVPTSHAINKEWLQHAGSLMEGDCVKVGPHGHSCESNAESDAPEWLSPCLPAVVLQCIACGKWRRLPAHQSWGLSESADFYCSANLDTRFAKCNVAEEDWERCVPVKGDKLMVRIDQDMWLEGEVDRDEQLTAKREARAKREASMMEADVPESYNCFEQTIVEGGGRHRKKPEVLA